MIVADTSALISLAIADSLTPLLNEYDVHTTQTVVTELEDTAAYDESHGQAADDVLHHMDQLTVHETTESSVMSARIDEGEATCLTLTKEREAAFLLTDDLRALPELQALIDAHVAISPLVLKALITRNIITRREAKDCLEHLATTRDWLGAPIYRRAQQLFDEDA